MDKINNDLGNMRDIFISYFDHIKNKYNAMSKETLFAGMIIKKTIEYLETGAYVYRKKLINVQISLIRLLCDNCLAIESCNELGLQSVIDLIQNGEKVSSIMLDEEQNMSDGYLKRKVADKYKGFDRLYKFACDSVHFSTQTVKSVLEVDPNGRQSINVSVSSPELQEELKANYQSMLVLSKIILDMLTKLLG